MENMPINPQLYLLLNLHCLIGGVAAAIARAKGRRLGVWLVLGLIGGTAALIAALFLPKKEAA
jgi:hypothetical protein